MEHLINLISRLEESGWEWSMTFDGNVELYLGNQLRSTSKYDVEAIKALTDEIEYW